MTPEDLDDEADLRTNAGVEIRGGDRPTDYIKPEDDDPFADDEPLTGRWGY